MILQIKVLLITGGTGTSGRALTKVLVTTNATTIASYINDKEMENLKSQVKKAELIRADITKEDEVKELISIIIERYSHIDILVNVVGGYIDGKSVAELDEREWDMMMNMNLKSAFLVSKYVISQMIAAKFEKIIHISSKTGLKSHGYDSAYAASKSGLIRRVESILEEVKESNININCILPSVIDMEANRRAMPHSDFSKWVKTEDLTNVVLFLCSEHSKIINGAAIPVYGLS
jgi:NAD(P)-dependent dehydrogenase (short-subunit alcohol dehydrogenase family)